MRGGPTSAERRTALARLEASGLYLLFDPRTRPDWEETLAAIAEAGVVWFQLRAKGATAAELATWAPKVRAAIGPAGIWILNDDPELARALGADGVHVGPDDPSVFAARRLMGARALVGFSEERPGRLRRPPVGADYAGVGAWRRTPTKPDAGRPLGPGGLRLRVAVARVPVVAVGGVRLVDAPRLARMGVAGAAIQRAIWAAPDPGAAARTWIRWWRANRR